MSESRITVLSYFMVLIGYMTITLSLPLAGLRLDGLSSTVFQYGVALSFFIQSRVKPLPSGGGYKRHWCSQSVR